MWANNPDATSPISDHANGGKDETASVPALIPIQTGHYPFLYLHQRVLSICAEAGVICLDLLPVFMPYLTDPSKVGDLWVNRFDAHMSPFANRLAAEKVLEVRGPI